MNKGFYLLFNWMFFCFFLIPPKALSQVIQGKVLDAETQFPVEFANISIKGEYIGTISNVAGEFYLKPNRNCSNKTLVVSFIGYETKEYTIDGKYLEIKLTPIATAIDEVIIRPDSTLFTLLKKAYKRIPDNYPDEPTLLQGFYRESVLNSSNDYLYIAEAIINSYKTSYRNSQFGQVEIIKSRKNILPGIDSINNVKFYGGPFVMHSNDIVHERKEIIKPQTFKKYNYTFLGSIPYGPYELYKISFESKEPEENKRLQGFFYLEAKTLSYVYFEYEIVGSWIQTAPEVKYSYAWRKILYQEINKKWTLKSVIGEQHAYNLKTKKNFLMKTEYVTNLVADSSVKPIPFENQMQFGDIFTHTATSYEESFWNDYNIIKQDSSKVNSLIKQLNYESSKDFLEKKFENKLTTTDKLLQITRKINFELGFVFLDYSFPVQNTNLIVNGVSINNESIISSGLTLGYYSILGYKPNNRLSINLKASESFNKNLFFKSYQFGVEYLFCLKKGGKQIFLLPGTGYSLTTSGAKIGEITLSEDITIEQKKIKKGEYTVYSGKKNQAIAFDLKFKTSISKRLSFTLGVDYFMPVRIDDHIIFKEDFGLFKKQAVLPLNNQFEYYENNTLVHTTAYSTQNFTIYSGIRFEF